MLETNDTSIVPIPGRAAITASESATSHEATRCGLVDMVPTADGSPTLVDSSVHAGFSGETMHSSRGALSESCYVYGPAIRMGITAALKPPLSDAAKESLKKTVHIAIVGLGLGYLERLCTGLHLDLLAQQSAAKNGNKGAETITLPKLLLTSFESNDDLVSRFQRWLSGDSDAWHCSVDEAFHHKGIKGISNDFRSSLQAMWERGDLIFGGALGNPESTQAGGSWNTHNVFDVVLYDPYSGSSNPQLWDTDFLGAFLRSRANPTQCVFATYASRTDLRRTLSLAGFKTIVRPGFGNKRECTLATKGIHDPGS